MIVQLRFFSSRLYPPCTGLLMRNEELPTPTNMWEYLYPVTRWRWSQPPGHEPTRPWDNSGKPMSA
jgi:hypothetical protein